MTDGQPSHHVYGEIASGGMATVYLASYCCAGTTVAAALKQLHPHLAKQQAFRTMLLDEARLSSRIVHPNVVRTLGVLEEGSDAIIVMEYVEGLPLVDVVRNALKRGGDIDPAIAAGIVVGMLHGLEAAHRATDEDGVCLELVHRDVSPQNILVGSDGVPRLLDFGIAKARNRLTSTEEGVARGKRGYMAPEQLRGEAITRATDLFAAGVVLWEVIAGERLFGPDDARSGWARRAREDVRLRPSERRRRGAGEVPPAMDDVALRCLRRQPGERFSSAREMAHALTAAIPPAPPSAIAAWLEQVASAELRRMRARVAALDLRPAVTDDDPTTPVDSPRKDSWTARGLAVTAHGATKPQPSRGRRLADVMIANALLLLGVTVAAKALMRSSWASPIAAARAAMEAPPSPPSPAAPATPAAPTPLLAFTAWSDKPPSPVVAASAASAASAGTGAATCQTAAGGAKRCSVQPALERQKAIKPECSRRNDRARCRADGAAP